MGDQVIEPDPNPADDLRGWKSKVVKAFILANPGATLREVSKATRSSEKTVSNVRATLLRAGMIAPAPTGRPPVTEETDAEEQIRRDIDAAIASGTAKILTRDERRQRLSQYADHPKVPHAAKIAALRELEATEPSEQEQKLGPGVPLTTEERVHRVALMIEALVDIDGKEALRDAITKAGAQAPASNTLPSVEG